MKVTHNFRVATEALNDTVTFEERPKGRPGRSHVDTLGESTPEKEV